MKLVLGLLMVLSVPALAMPSVSMTLVPATPVVIANDLILDPGTANEYTVTGPWFKVNPVITNTGSQEILISAVSFTIETEPGSFDMWYFGLATPLKLAPGATGEFGENYVEQLPDMGTTAYKVKAAVMGTEDEKSEDVTLLEMDFSTQ